VPKDDNRSAWVMRANGGSTVPSGSSLRVWPSIPNPTGAVGDSSSQTGVRRGTPSWCLP
jgi:hypothetical protein